MLAMKMEIRDDWNNALVSLAGQYSNTIGVDASSYVGTFRAGGDPGNLWDIIPEYASPPGGGHFNQAGHTKIAQALADSLTEVLPQTGINNKWIRIPLSINHF